MKMSPPVGVTSPSLQGERIERSIGAILVDSGRLSHGDAESILRMQRDNKLRFGDAGIALGLLSQADIDFALSRQFGYAYLDPNDSRISQKVVAAFQPFTPIVEQLRMLRSQLMLRWLSAEHGRKTIAITGVARREGKSFVAANLAVVFSQLGERTLLIDADLRNPAQHVYFKLENRIGLANVLNGMANAEAIQRVPALGNLSVLPAGTLPPNPQELLAGERFPELLKRLSQGFDVIILDTSAAQVCADAHLVAARAAAAVLVARKDHTSIEAAQEFVQGLASARVTLLGSVLSNH